MQIAAMSYLKWFKVYWAAFWQRYVSFIAEMVASLWQLTLVYLLLTELVAGLRDQRLPDGTTDSVGEVLVNWV